MRKSYWIETAKYWEGGILNRTSILAIGKWLQKLFNGRRGRFHPNDKFPFIHREATSRAWNIDRAFIRRFAWGAIFTRPVLGSTKKVVER
jgi:hypothetical protein